CPISTINRTEIRESSELCPISTINRTEIRESSELCPISTINQTEIRESIGFCPISCTNENKFKILGMKNESRAKKLIPLIYFLSLYLKRHEVVVFFIRIR